MSKHKRKSYLLIVKEGHWWFPAIKKWIPDDQLMYQKEGYFSNHRRFRTLKRLEKAIQSTEPPFSASADYYKATKKGKGWYTKWEYNEQ
jgi:hypothetical protein